MERDILLDAAERPQAPRRVGFAVAGVALFAAIAVPDIPPGLGLTLVAFGVAAAVALAAPIDADRVTLLYAGLALALAAMPVIRASEWVLALDLAAATGLGALAVTRALAWREIFRAPFSVMSKFWHAVGFVVAPLLPRRGVPRRLGPVVRGAALGSLLLLVFGSLFAAADRAFARIASDLLLPNVDLGLLPARLIVFAATLVGSGALILAGRRYAIPTKGDATASEPTRRLGRTEWLTALTLLDLLFLGFVLIQVTILFAGHRYVLATEGVTYAEYARQGFFQLLVVGALTLAVIAGAVRWARREGPRDMLLLRFLLGTLSVLTLVILASALRRLNLYEDAYGLTQLRFSVHATILWMAGIFVLLLAAGATMRTSWLPRVAVLFTATGILAFTLVNPDGVVAEHNVRRFQETGILDLHYASSLGVDAVPALAELPPGLRCWVLRPVAERLTVDDPLLGWNAARSKARELLGPVGSSAPMCDPDALKALPGGRWESV
jgi:Domain of unknown function (DUF4153)